MFGNFVKRPDPRKHNIIGTKWIYRNKQDEHGQVVRNKAHLIAQGYTQVEGIDFNETVSASSATPSWFWSIDDKPGWGTNVFVRIAG